MSKAQLLKVDISVTENGRKSPQWSLESDLNGEVSLAEFLEFTKSSLIIIASTALKEEQGYGFDEYPVVVVDGKQNRPVSAVHPLGQIDFVARAVLNDILIETYKGILERSPVDTGKYIASNYVLYNNMQVAKSMSGLMSWLKTAEISPTGVFKFVNVQPYARKLERLGVRAGNEGTGGVSRSILSRDKKKRAKGIKVNVPNGAYFLTARQMKNKYKNNVNIKFDYITGSSLGSVVTGQNIENKRFRKRKRDGKKGPRTYLYPMIQITGDLKGTKK